MFKVSAKMNPRGPQEAPRGPQEAPKKPPRGFQDAARRLPEDTQESPDSKISFIFRRFLKDFGICSFSAFRWPKTAQGEAKVAPRTPQEGAKFTQKGAETCQDNHRMCKKQQLIADDGGDKA